MTVLCDSTIREYCDPRALRADASGLKPLIEPFYLEQLQPASYDLMLGEILGFIGKDGEEILLGTHQFCLGSTVEFVNIPDFLVARIEGKSSMARKGLMVHTAGFIDPGFRGQLTLEIVNHGEPFLLKRGMKIAQLAFQTLDKPAARPYGHPELGSHYQHQVGPTPAR